MSRTQHQKGDRNSPRNSADIVPLPWHARRKRRPAPKRAHPTDPDDYPVSDRTLLLIAACIGLLILGSIWLLETMHKNSILEDCLMAGRRNCTPIVAPSQVR
jgi:hypothetical protein